MSYRRAVWSQILDELGRGLIDEACIRERFEPAALHAFEYNAETYDALREGTGDAVVDDSPIAAWFVASSGGLRLLGDLPGTESHHAMLFANGSWLREALDAEVERLEAEGRLDAWRKRWFA